MSYGYDLIKGARFFKKLKMLIIKILSSREKYDTRKKYMIVLQSENTFKSFRKGYQTIRDICNKCFPVNYSEWLINISVHVSMRLYYFEWTYLIKNFQSIIWCEFFIRLDLSVHVCLLYVNTSCDKQHPCSTPPINLIDRTLKVKKSIVSSRCTSACIQK